jgi:dual specificity phosphatase 12
VYPLVDDETDNILRFQDRFSEDLSKELSSGSKVLVHCQQGVSRSVGLVTGYIMKMQRILFPEAYDFIQRIYPAANIADNFRSQLTDYGAILEWDARLFSQVHRMYRAKYRLSSVTTTVASNETPQRRYICRKCRESLFLDTQIVPGNSENYRIECMQWMSCRDEVSGPLSCPRCKSKIGSYNLAGMLEMFDGPVFIITKSKIDEMPLSLSFKGDSFPKTMY